LMRNIFLTHDGGMFPPKLTQLISVDTQFSWHYPFK
jgi:hypothetical protein